MPTAEAAVESRTAGHAASLKDARRWGRTLDDGRSARDAVLDALRSGDASGAPAEFVERDLRGIRLIGEDLSGLDLSGLDLSGADLSRADLSGSRLVSARLRDAKLFGAVLNGTEALAADLEGADLTECRGEKTAFGSASLRGATLFNASLPGVSLTKADLTDADARAAKLEDARLRDARLTGADFTRASLARAELENAAVDGAVFDCADLRDARLRAITGFSTATWVGADILGVDPCGAYLVVRDIKDQNYLHEFRSKSPLNATIYWIWWATSDCGRSFVRWGLWTLFLAAVFAGLIEMADFDYGDHQTPLSSLYYSVITLTTLGYGDVVPASMGAQALAMTEVTLGYVMLGGLLSIFANKMARRAD